MQSELEMHFAFLSRDIEIRVAIYFSTSLSSHGFFLSSAISKKVTFDWGSGMTQKNAYVTVDAFHRKAQNAISHVFECGNQAEKKSDRSISRPQTSEMPKYLKKFHIRFV